MVKKVQYLLLLLFFSGSLSLFSQTQGVLGKRFFDNWSAGFGAGPGIFFGDLKVHRFWPATHDMSEVKFGGNFTLTRQLSHVFAIRGQFLYSELSGTKRLHKNGDLCNEYFDGNILEGNINATINFTNIMTRGYKPNRKFFLYGTIGLGTSTWNSKVKQLGTGIPIRRNDSLAVWSTSLMGMAGVGAFVNLGDKVNLGVEWTLHGVNSDLLDATAGGFKYDAYSMVSINLTYNFNKRNPGKEPEKMKATIPAFVEPPVIKTVPVDTIPPVVEQKMDTAMVDTTAEMMEMPAEQDSSELLGSKPEIGLIFRVQIFAFKTDRYSVQEVRDKYNLSEEVYKDFSDSWYRFTIGSFNSYADAKVLKNQMRKRGFKGAFIARYNNGIRVNAHGEK